MTETPDHNELARRYLELWQEQISGAAGDPAVADAMARMMAGWQSVMGQTFGQQSPAGHGEGEGHGATGRNGDTGTGKTGSEAASAASGGADDAIRQLLERIADLERRVEQLEHTGRKK
ncbi:hypothetical protein [Hwanghaeella grinnelliae]|uniref:hypothetical protein n=1 Tax=Hwanghaeella grinnelliae TaxID=2500179 RepID=UPI001386CA62|nr:hypothetical protein [Hwanghaeella grinnelliae]